MQLRRHSLYRGEIWFRHPDSTVTLTFLSTVNVYVGTLAANQEHAALLVDRMPFLIRVLGDPQCSIVPQIEIDVDVIEVRSVATLYLEIIVYHNIYNITYDQFLLSLTG